MLSRIAWKLLKPEYLARPGELLVRRWRDRRKDRPATIHGGLAIELFPDEMISDSIRRKGHYDLVLSEVVRRLLDPGETAVDVGAHVGYVTALMARCVGPTGRVLSLEPHPECFRLLESNVERWRSVSRITARNLAASDRAGRTKLAVPAGWEHNRGAASAASERVAEGSEGRTIEVECATLDDLVGNGLVALAKIDVEGFESAVIRGAGKILAEGRCRDIVFEDFGTYPSEAMRLLEAAGYALFSLAKAFSGPRLASPDRRGVNPQNERNYLATRDARRAIDRMAVRGYRVLGRRPPDRPPGDPGRAGT